MKKLAFIFTLFLSGIYAQSIDKDSISVTFEGYKTADMVGVQGYFGHVKYTFSKDDGTLFGPLKGAKAVIVPSSANMGVDIITGNIVNTFFKIFSGKNNLEVTFINIVEGNDKGVITANVKIGNEQNTFPLTYTIKDNKLEAKGQLDISGFQNSKEALTELSKVAPGHGNISWPLVNITFSADITN